MFWLCLTKRIKSYLMNFLCMFGSFFLPLLLAVLFVITIPDAKYQNFSSIPVAIVNESDDYLQLYIAMQGAKSSTGEKLFRVSLCTEVTANDKLTSGGVVAYIKCEEGFHITARSGGNKVLVIKTYIDWYQLTRGRNVLNMDMQYAIEKCGEPDFNRNEIYYLCVLAFAAISSIYWGVRIIMDIEGHFAVGIRTKISPVSTVSIAVQNVLGAFTVSIFGNAIIVLVIDRLTNMNLMSCFSYVMLVLLLTSIVGLEIGVYIGLWKNGSYTVKYRLCNVILIISGFMAGLFMFKMRYVVDVNAPAAAVINPVNVATDALYCLYFTHEMEQYSRNLLILITLIVVLTIGIALIIRRKRHVHI